MNMHSGNDGNERRNTIGRWVFWGFALIAIYFLFTEHRAHTLSALPYLLLAACPLMHLFHHHGGHGHQSGHGGQSGSGPGRDQAVSPDVPNGPGQDKQQNVSGE